MKDAIKKIRQLKASIRCGRFSLEDETGTNDLLRLVNQLETIIKKIPQDKTQEILDYVKDSNSQLDDLLHYVCQNANPCVVPTPSNELLLSYNRELIDRCSPIFYILEQYFNLKNK